MVISSEMKKRRIYKKDNKRIPTRWLNQSVAGLNAPTLLSFLHHPKRYSVLDAASSIKYFTFSIHVAFDPERLRNFVETHKRSVPN